MSVIVSVSDIEVATEPPKRLRLSPDERRTSILDAAQKLFFERGWDDVTIADVLTEAGISKGGFYHHFAAKEDLLDGVIGRFTFEALAAAEAARAATSGNALARFNAFLAETNRWKAEQGPLLKFYVDVLLLPGNDVLFDRIQAAGIAAAKPIVLDMINHGVDEGTFDVPDAVLVTETIMAMGIAQRAIIVSSFEAAKMGDFDRAVSILDDRMTAEGALIDRMLGLPQNSIVLTNPKEFRLMMSAIAWD